MLELACSEWELEEEPLNPPFPLDQPWSVELWLLLHVDLPTVDLVSAWTGTDRLHSESHVAALTPASAP